MLLLSLAAAGRGGQCPDAGARGSAPLIAGRLASAWAAAFTRQNPTVPIAVAAPFGPPVGALDPQLESFLEGKTDFAFLTREIAERDLDTFRRAHDGSEPIVIPVARGAWNRFGYVDAVVVIVNAANPIGRLSFRQIDAIFSATHWRGGPAVTDWSGLGVTAWRGRRIHIVGGGAWSTDESARALTIRRRVLSLPGHLGAWRPASGTGAEAEVVDRVAADPLAIGFTGMGHLKNGVRAIPIAKRDDEPAMPATATSIASDTYPLARTVDLLTARKTSCATLLRKFARFALSAEGQEIVARDSPFMPLARQARRRGLRRIVEIVAGNRSPDPIRRTARR